MTSDEPATGNRKRRRRKSKREPRTDGHRPSRHAVRSRGRRIRDGMLEGVATYWYFYGFFLICGLALLAGSAPRHYAFTSSARALLHDLRSLPAASARTTGERSILEGTIAADEKPIFRHFVAYMKYSRRSGGRDRPSYWQADGGRIAAFHIRTGTGTVRIARPTYHFTPAAKIGTWSWLQFGSLLHEWDHADRRDGAEPGGARTSIEYRGLVPGRPVLAIGRMDRMGRFDAERVIAGTREGLTARVEQIASARATGMGIYYWSTILALAIIVLTAGLWLFGFARLVREHLRAAR